MKITKEQKEKLKKIGEKHGIKLAMIFGSRARQGMPREDSDLDIAFILKNTRQKKYKYYYSPLFNDFSNVFKGYNIDLTNIKNTDFIFRYELLLNSQSIIGKPLDYAEFKARAYREYMDSYDLLKLYDILSAKKKKLLNKKIYA